MLALNSEVIRWTGKKPVDAIKVKSVDTKSSRTYSRPVGMKATRLFKECEMSLCRWGAGRRSKTSRSSRVVSEGLRYEAWFRQRRASDCSLKPNYLQKEFVDLEKTNKK